MGQLIQPRLEEERELGVAVRHVAILAVRHVNERIDDVAEGGERLVDGGGFLTVAVHELNLEANVLWFSKPVSLSVSFFSHTASLFRSLFT